MTDKEIAKAVKLIDARAKAIASERDKLDALISEWSALLEDCDNALELLVEARDTLSQLI